MNRTHKHQHYACCLCASHLPRSTAPLGIGGINLNRRNTWLAKTNLRSVSAHGGTTMTPRARGPRSKGAIEALKDIRAGYATTAGLGTIILAGAVVVSGVRAVCDCRSIRHWA
jgi:hypothetical protein